MKNQKGKRVKRNIFGIFEKHDVETKNENIFGVVNTLGKVLMNFLILINFTKKNCLQKVVYMQVRV